MPETLKGWSFLLLYLVVLADDDVLSVEDLRDVLFTHIISRVQRILRNHRRKPCICSLRKYLNNRWGSRAVSTPVGLHLYRDGLLSYFNIYRNWPRLNDESENTLRPAEFRSRWTETLRDRRIRICLCWSHHITQPQSVRTQNVLPDSSVYCEPWLRRWGKGNH